MGCVSQNIHLSIKETIPREFSSTRARKQVRYKFVFVFQSHENNDKSQVLKSVCHLLLIQDPFQLFRKTT